MRQINKPRAETVYFLLVTGQCYIHPNKDNDR